MICRLFCTVFILVSLAGHATPVPDTLDNRLDAARHLFELPAYRLIATRQLYVSLNTLPAEQHQRARAALSDPAVMASSHGVISRSMAQTFSTAALEHPARFLQTDEARTMIDKAQGFQTIPGRELLGASESDPGLIKVLIGK